MKKVFAVFLVIAILCSISATAFAENFTPSVERKDAPEIVETESAAGVKADAIITDTAGSETLVGTSTDLQLVITPISKKDSAIVEDITTFLNDAEDQIENSDNLSELTPELETALQKLKSESTDPAIQELNISDLLVSDLFDVSLVRDSETIEELSDGQKITFSLKTSLTKDDVFFILHNYEGNEWEVVNDYSLADDGVLTITLDSLSPIAIIIDSIKEIAVAGGPAPDGSSAPVGTAPTSPQTGESSSASYLAGALLFGFAAAALILFARRKQAEK